MTNWTGWALALLLTATGLSAQQTSSTFWVTYTDKGDTSQWDITEVLSPRSLARRARHKLPIDWYDYPPNPAYTQAVVQAGGRLAWSSRWFNASVAELTPEAFRALESQAFVRSIRPVRRFKAVNAGTVGPTQERSALDRAVFPQLDMLQLPHLHEMGHSGKGVLVAVHDDGFNNVDTISGFGAWRENGGIVSYYDFVDDDSIVFRQGGHGTAVLSCIVGQVDTEDSYIQGAAPGIKAVLFRTEDAGSESLVEEDNWLRAAEIADSFGVDIIHASLGYSEFDDPAENHTYADMDGNTSVITRAADLACSRGILCVNSAGNSGNDDWNYVSAPADADSVLVVGAVNGQGIVTSFSSRGPTFDDRLKPDVTAMGGFTTVIGTDGEVRTANGTSFSSPITSGFAAAVLSGYPEATTPELYCAIVQSGDNVQSPDNLYGYGIPNAPLALRYLENRHGIEGRVTAITEEPNPVTGYQTFYFPRQHLGDDILYLVKQNGIVLDRAFFKPRQLHTYCPDYVLNLKVPAGGNVLVEFYAGEDKLTVERPN